MTSPRPERPSRARGAGPSTPGRRAQRGLRRVEETSAGGLVLDTSTDPHRAVLISRRDRAGRLVWSMPKGHLEPGETAEQAAVREVEEETGIRSQIREPLGTIDFWFVAEGRRVHKTVHHFVLDHLGGELSDADIEVESVEWVALDQVIERLAYPDERRLLRSVPGLLSP